MNQSALDASGWAPGLAWLILLLPVLTLLGIVSRSRRIPPVLLTLQAAASCVFAGWIGSGQWGMALGGVDIFGQFGLRYDALALTLVILVALLGAALLRFSDTYLGAETKREVFLRRVVMTVAFVQWFALSNHLLIHLGAWLGISLTVHRLLRHYAQRKTAVMAAKKKFLLSRLGDGFMVTGLLLLATEYGTLQVDALLGAVSSHNGAPGFSVIAATCCLVSAAACKSAQVPLHAWLPETMEAPTPVSALMHAGVVNAGPFLLLRLHPMFSDEGFALSLLVVIGGLTAVVGLLAQAVQPTIKLRLAWSTVAQMGFVFLELGLGLFAAALIHLVAHAAYKAHAFLRSGTVVLASPAPAKPPVVMAAHLLLGVGLVLLGLGAAHGFQSGDTAWVFLSFLWGMSLAAAWQGKTAGTEAASGLSAATHRLGAVAVAAFIAALVIAAEHALGGWFAPISTPDERGFAGLALAVFVLAALFLTGVALNSVWRDGTSTAARAWRVHFLNGLYFGPVTDRIVEWLWPADGPEPPARTAHRTTTSLLPRSIG